VGNESSDGAFNAPSLLQPSEARGWCAFPVKSYDYGGGVLSDGAMTRIKGASPPGSRRPAIGGGVAPATCTSRHVDWGGAPTVPGNAQERFGRCT
jgi:hypothetical protein